MKINGNGSVHDLVLAAALSMGLGFGTHASAVDYSYLIDLNTRTATDLGNVTATAINDAGQVVGYYPTSAPEPHAFITGPNGVGMTDLGTLGGSWSQAFGINAAGRVVGESVTASGQGDAFITGANGVGMIDLPDTVGQDGTSVGVGINASGQVAGNSGDYFGGKLFITGPNGVGITDLDTPGSFAGYEVTGINAAGQVVGVGSTPGGMGVPFEVGGFITGPNGVGMTGSALSLSGINDAGEVVGTGITRLDLYSFNSWGAIAGPNGTTVLDSLDGSMASAEAINDAGQAVGWSGTASDEKHAFVTGANGVGTTDLNSLVHLPDGLVMDNAIAINNVGQVIVHATEHVSHVPEPESYALMLAGMTLIGTMVRRTQKG